jgi:hypothetical protein
MKMRSSKLVKFTLTLIACALPSVSFANDLFQDAGSWLQVVGEGSLKVINPSFEKGRMWLEGQARFERALGSLVSRHGSLGSRLFIE